MAFDPTGGFGKGPLLQDALDAAEAFKGNLPDLKGLLRRLYLHWAVAPFGCTFGDYNYMVNLVDGKWVLQATHNPQDNMAGLNGNAAASHTWERNTNAIGIAIGGMDGATSTSFGSDGVQMHELEYLCALAALCCVTYGLESNGTVAAPGETHPSSNDSGNVPGPINTTGEFNIETHATCAMYDDYRGERWDLGCLVPLPDGMALTDEIRKTSAACLRARIHQYAVAQKA